MRANMPPAAYIDQEWFDRERDVFFKPLWQFIGLKVMLTKPNAFITRTLCGIPLVIQNFSGELRAFENICLHRQNPLQVAPHGVRPLVCSYHGWGYGNDGAPNNIPFEAELYRFPETERACLKLRRFAVHCIGNLVFVNLSENPLPILQQFGEALIVSLTAASEAFDDEVIFTTYESRFNWKLAYENLRDGHHPRYLHSQSLFQGVKFAPRVNEETLANARRLRKHGISSRDEAMSLARSFSFGGLDTPMPTMAHYKWHENVKRFGDQDLYYNWLVFPNLHIASGSGGYSFIIEHHIPVSAGRTDIMVHYVTAKKKNNYASSPAVLHSHMMNADVVLREDLAVMANIQKTLHANAPHAHLGDFDTHDAVIEHWYLAVMEGKIVL